MCDSVPSCYAHCLTDVQMWRRSWVGGRPRQASSTSVWAGTTTTRRNSRYGTRGSWALSYVLEAEGLDGDVWGVLVQVMVEVLSMCKTLGDLMAREEHALAPSIR